MGVGLEGGGLQKIFGQNHLIFGQAMDKIFGQLTSAPPPPPLNETDPVRLWTMWYLYKCAGVEIHSFRSHIRDHFVLEWKSTLKIVESALKRVIQTTPLEYMPL